MLFRVSGVFRSSSGLMEKTGSMVIWAWRASKLAFEFNTLVRVVRHGG
jgi:hypothetical protein